MNHCAIKSRASMGCSYLLWVHAVPVHYEPGPRERERKRERGREAQWKDRRGTESNHSERWSEKKRKEGRAGASKLNRWCIPVIRSVNKMPCRIGVWQGRVTLWRPECRESYNEQGRCRAMVLKHKFSPLSLQTSLHGWWIIQIDYQISVSSKRCWWIVTGFFFFFKVINFKPFSVGASSKILRSLATLWPPCRSYVG